MGWFDDSFLKEGLPIGPEGSSVQMRLHGGFLLSVQLEERM
jgi:hypothetical protein